MTKRARSSVRRPLPPGNGSGVVPGLLALGLLLLQLTTALHFALIPHSFNAGLSGFQHMHAERLSGVTESAPDRPAIVTGHCEGGTEACALGFCGPVSVLLAQPAVTGRLALPAVSAPVAAARRVLARAQLLLVAPKTSPPRAA